MAFAEELFFEVEDIDEQQGAFILSLFEMIMEGVSDEGKLKIAFEKIDEEYRSILLVYDKMLEHFSKTNDPAWKYPNAVHEKFGLATVTLGLLDVAILRGNLSAVKLLFPKLENEADSSFWACLSMTTNNLEVVKYLYDAGARYDEEEAIWWNLNCNVAQYAILFGQVQTFHYLYGKNKLLFSHYYSYPYFNDYLDTLSFAIGSGQYGIIKHCLELGAVSLSDFYSKVIKPGILDRVKIIKGLDILFSKDSLTFSGQRADDILGVTLQLLLLGVNFSNEKYGKTFERYLQSVCFENFCSNAVEDNSFESLDFKVKEKQYLVHDLNFCLQLFHAFKKISIQVNFSENIQVLIEGLLKKGVAKQLEQSKGGASNSMLFFQPTENYSLKSLEKSFSLSQFLPNNLAQLLLARLEVEKDQLESFSEEGDQSKPNVEMILKNIESLDNSFYKTLLEEKDKKTQILRELRLTNESEGFELKK